MRARGRPQPECELGLREHRQCVCKLPDQTLAMRASHEALDHDRVRPLALPEKQEALSDRGCEAGANRNSSVHTCVSRPSSILAPRP